MSSVHGSHLSRITTNSQSGLNYIPFRKKYSASSLMQKNFSKCTSFCIQSPSNVLSVSKLITPSTQEPQVGSLQTSTQEQVHFCAADESVLVDSESVSKQVKEIRENTHKGEQMPIDEVSEDKTRTTENIEQNDENKGDFVTQFDINKISQKKQCPAHSFEDAQAPQHAEGKEETEEMIPIEDQKQNQEIGQAKPQTQKTQDPQVPMQLKSIIKISDPSRQLTDSKKSVKFVLPEESENPEAKKKSNSKSKNSLSQGFPTGGSSHKFSEVYKKLQIKNKSPQASTRTQKKQEPKEQRNSRLLMRFKNKGQSK